MITQFKIKIKPQSAVMHRRQRLPEGASQDPWDRKYDELPKVPHEARTTSYALIIPGVRGARTVMRELESGRLFVMLSGNIERVEDRQYIDPEAWERELKNM